MEKPKRSGQLRRASNRRRRAAIRSVRRGRNRLSLRSRINEGPFKTNVAQSKGKSSRPAEQTLEEVKYLKQLIEQKIPVCVKLSDDEEVRGVIEYYDQRFIRVTRDGAPNLFIFKQDIKYLYEVA